MARAIAFGKRIVILDEPTSALGARESGNVLRLIKEAPEQGVSVIVISHNLEHVMEVADRAVVLRQGHYIGETEPTAENHEQLVAMIVGSEQSEKAREGSRALVATLLAALRRACGGQLSGGEQSDKIKIGFVPKSLNQEYWVNTKRGAESIAKAKHTQMHHPGGRRPTLEILEQIDIVENLLAQKINALVIAPSDADLLLPVLERAAQEIPVMLFDSDIADWKRKVAYVGTKNFDGGPRAGKYIAQQLKDGASSP